MSTKALKVGDRVEFKNDIEGSGIVAKVNEERNWLTGRMQYDYLVRSESEPNGYPFHRMATFDDSLNAMVVNVDEDHIWLIDDKEETPAKVAPKTTRKPATVHIVSANYRALISTTKERTGNKKITKATNAAEAAQKLGVYNEWSRFQVIIQVSDGKKWTTVHK